MDHKERIKRMVVEAELPLQDIEGLLEHHPEALNRLAQAVVRECAEFVKLKQYRSGRTEIDGVRHGHWPTDLAQQMLDSFGLGE